MIDSNNNNIKFLIAIHSNDNLIIFKTPQALQKTFINLEIHGYLQAWLMAAGASYSTFVAD